MFKQNVTCGKINDETKNKSNWIKLKWCHYYWLSISQHAVVGQIHP